uniref:Uncharacterized protein n=1 Tax=Romanomermis culicivorax TaxID=13658 RepID=A0A915IED5_ROMCU
LSVNVILAELIIFFLSVRTINWFGVGRSIKERCGAGDNIPVAAQWCGKVFHERLKPFDKLHRYCEIGSSIELQPKYRCNPFLNGPYS